MADLASLMDEFGLQEAFWATAEGSVAFSRNAPTLAGSVHVTTATGEPEPAPPVTVAAPSPALEVPKGTPVSSPMIGIFYGASSPGTPPFVKLGDVVSAGHVVGLIEAMKVFNEITAPVAGTITEILAEGGQLVQPGEPLLYIA